MGYAPHHRLSGGASPRGEAAKRLSLLLEQKKSNKVRPSSVNVVDSFPPRGSREAAELVIRAKKSNKVRPSSVNVVDSFPPRGSLEKG